MPHRMKDTIFGFSLLVSLIVGYTLNWGIVFTIALWLLAYVCVQVSKYLAKREATRRALIRGPRPLMYRRGRLVPWLPTPTSRPL